MDGTLVKSHLVLSLQRFFIRFLQGRSHPGSAPQPLIQSKKAKGFQNDTSSDLEWHRGELKKPGGKIDDTCNRETYVSVAICFN